MLQMHEAVLEGLYCCIGQAIKTRTIDMPINFETYQKKKLEAIYFRENLTFRKMLKPNEPAELTFEIIGVTEKKIRRTFYSVTIRINGFMRGEVECLFEKPE
jgi:acyl dehydratase